VQILGGNKLTVQMISSCLHAALVTCDPRDSTVLPKDAGLQYLCAVLHCTALLPAQRRWALCKEWSSHTWSVVEYNVGSSYIGEGSGWAVLVDVGSN
jgi:hypothetical protein